jgi:aspartate/tyrosine/aromatic aminotransferase
MMDIGHPRVCSRYYVMREQHDGHLIRSRRICVVAPNETNVAAVAEAIDEVTRGSPSGSGI